MAATTAIVASIGAAAMTTISNIQNQNAAEKQAKANEKLANNEATAARIEQAQNANAYRSQARQQTASAEASMGAAGNVGGSSEALSRASLLNLGKDLSALKYNYDSKAVSALNQAENYKVNAKVARMNSTSALIGGSLNTVAAGANSYINAYNAGLVGKKPKVDGGTN